MITNFPNGAASWGFPILPPGGIPPGGAVFWLDPSHALANDGNGKTGVGASITKPMATLPGAYALLRANKHDVVMYKAGSTSLNLSATLTWAKNYAHLIGLCAPSKTAQRARIFQASDATSLSPLINITATGCIFSNIYVFQGVDDAGSLLNIQVTGGRNFFGNIHFAGGGHATMAINGAGSLKLNGAEENRFVGCTIGVDTISAATGVAGMLMDGEAHRNEFEDCDFALYAGNANVFHVEVIDNTGFDRRNTFRRCLFTNVASQSMDTVFEIPAGVGLPRVMYLMDGTVQHGADDWDDNDRGVVFLALGTITAGGNAGIMQATNST